MSDPTTAPFSAVSLADVVTDSGLPDGTAILAVGARPGAPYAVSRWEQSIA